MISLGNGREAYGWYKTTVRSDSARTAPLEFTGAGDRLTLFINGRRIGISAHPPENRSGEWPILFNVPLAAGENVITVLADNLGLVKGPWQIGRSAP